MSKVITVAAGKGGTGKTTTVAALASCLAALGYKTLCIDFDRGRKNLEYALCMPERRPSEAPDADGSGRWIAKACREHPRIRNLFYMSPYTRHETDSAVEADAAVMFNALRKEFDYCIVDAPSINSPAFRAAHADADMAIIVSSCDLPTMGDVRKAASRIKGAGVKNVKLLVNRYDPGSSKWVRQGVKDVAESIGVRLAGIIPEDKIVFQALHLRIPLVLFYKRYSAYHFLDVARRITGREVPPRIRLGMRPPAQRRARPQQPGNPEPPRTKVRSFGDPERWAKPTLPPCDPDDLVRVYEVKEGIYSGTETIRDRIWLHDVLDDNEIPYHIEIEGYWPGRRKFVERQVIYVEEKNAAKAKRLIKEFNDSDSILEDPAGEDSPVVGIEDGMPQKLCPSCGAEIDFDFVVCPRCKERI